MSANPNYDISNQYIPDSYDEDVVFDRIAKSFSEIIAKELDPDGTNPSLADDIKANIDSDPTFFENLSKSVFDGDEDATKDVVESLSNAAAVTAAAIPETLKQVIKNSAEKVRASAQAANDNLPTWFKNYVDDAVTNGNKLASEFGKKMGLLAAAIAVDKILDSNFAATEIFNRCVLVLRRIKENREHELRAFCAAANGFCFIKGISYIGRRKAFNLMNLYMLIFFSFEQVLGYLYRVTTLGTL